MWTSLIWAAWIDWSFPMEHCMIGPWNTSTETCKQFKLDNICNDLFIKLTGVESQVPCPNTLNSPPKLLSSCWLGENSRLAELMWNGAWTEPLIVESRLDVATRCRIEIMETDNTDLWWHKIASFYRHYYGAIWAQIFSQNCWSQVETSIHMAISHIIILKCRTLQARKWRSSY